MKVLVCLFIGLVGALGKGTPNLGSPDGRIVGGRDAQRGQYPFQVSVHYCIRSDACQHACGGVIISAFWIISAGHCITNAPTLGTYRILAGVLNLNDDNPERQLHTVSYALIHPQYEGGVGPHDLALFRLATRFQFSSAVLVAPLPSVDEQIFGDVIVTGWGSIGGSETPIMPSTLQFASLPYLNATACKTALDIVLNGAPHPLDLDTNICTGPLTGGSSICTGDSGGPLIYSRWNSTIEVIGISSWGITPCGRVGAPSVYVKIFPYLDWIRDNVSS